MSPNYLLWAVWISVIGAALYACFLKPSWVPALIALVLPFGDFDVNWGVTWSPAKVVVLLFLASLPAHLALRARFLSRMRLPPTLKTFLLAVVISTLVVYMVGSPQFVAGFGVMRGPLLRPLVQILSLCLEVAILLAILGLTRDEKATYRLLKATLISSTATAAYGLYQFTAYYLHLPGVLAIWTAQPGQSNVHGMFQVGGLSIFRVGSFVGEPKFAAAFLLPGIVLIACSRLFPLPGLRSALTSYPVLILHCVALVLTFSTSSLFALVVSAPLIVWLARIGPERAKLTGIVKIGFAVALGIVVLVSYSGPTLAARLWKSRVTHRISLVQGDPAGAAAMEFFREQPRYLIAGVGLGNASFYLRPYFNPYYHGRPMAISFNSGYIGNLFECGIIGLVTLAVFLAGWFVRGLRLLGSGKIETRSPLLATTLALCAAVGALNAFWSAGPELWLYWGILITLCQECETACARKQATAWRAHGDERWGPGRVQPADTWNPA